MCLLHGPGHDTNVCKVLKDQAEKMRAMRAAQSPNNIKPKRTFSNSFSKTYTKQEVNQMIETASAAAVKTALATKDKDEDNSASEVNNFVDLSLSDNSSEL